MNKPTNEAKIKRVIEQSTFYFYNRSFEEKYEGYLNSLKETLLILKNKIKTRGFKKELFENLLIEKENGLRAWLSCMSCPLCCLIRTPPIFNRL